MSGDYPPWENTGSMEYFYGQYDIAYQDHILEICNILKEYLQYSGWTAQAGGADFPSSLVTLPSLQVQYNNTGRNLSVKIMVQENELIPTVSRYDALDETFAQWRRKVDSGEKNKDWWYDGLRELINKLQTLTVNDFPHGGMILLAEGYDKHASFWESMGNRICSLFEEQLLVHGWKDEGFDHKNLVYTHEARTIMLNVNTSQGLHVRVSKI